MKTLKTILIAATLISASQPFLSTMPRTTAAVSSSYNQVLFVEKSRFSALHISVRRTSVMDISLHQVLK